ncbi:MAG: hypothetical protein HC787_02190 [Nostocaceae cyanobacterium CSU_2_110]|nr:hypothetical protein [Candidatus Methylacidiphilales bacterium]NJS16115.1 hypothetical protein [Nostocaceae cyanobacterium CSU_2_110]
MSIYQKTLNDFIHFLKSEPSWFSESDRTEIAELIESQDDDTKALANAISEWLEKYPFVYNAMQRFKQEIHKSSQIHSSNGHISSPRGPGSSKLNDNIPKYSIDKQSLKNAILPMPIYKDSSKQNQSNN